MPPREGSAAPAAAGPVSFGSPRSGLRAGRRLRYPLTQAQADRGPAVRRGRPEAAPSPPGPLRPFVVPGRQPPPVQHGRGQAPPRPPAPGSAQPGSAQPGRAPWPGSPARPHRSAAAEPQPGVPTRRSTRSPCGPPWPRRRVYRARMQSPGRSPSGSDRDPGRRLEQGTGCLGVLLAQDRVNPAPGRPGMLCAQARSVRPAARGQCHQRSPGQESHDQNGAPGPADGAPQQVTARPQPVHADDQALRPGLSRPRPPHHHPCPSAARSPASHQPA